MEEIKIGEYVRTDKGEIFKVLEIEKGSIRIKSNYREWIGICRIVNHSKNIIDLIQAEDLVYYTIKGLEHSTYIDIVSEHTDARTLEKTLRVRIYKLEQLNIKKILTKEQMNENIFEVVE